MPEITYISPSTTNHVISAKEYIAALTGDEFKQTDYIFKINGKALMESPLYKKLAWIIDIYSDNRKDDANEYEYENYLVIKNARIEGSPERIEDDFNTHCIFYQCVLPPLIIDKCSAFDLFFIGTHIESIRADWASCWGIYLDDNSVCGNISFENNSKCSSLNITTNSRCNDIDIQGKSNCTKIRIENNSRSGNVRIKHGSQLEILGIYHNSTCGLIGIVYHSACDHLTVQDNSECDSIYVSDASKAKSISLYRESKIGNINITKESQNYNGIAISNSQCNGVVIDDNSWSRSLDLSEKSAVSNISIANKSHCNWITFSGESKCEMVITGADSNCFFLDVNNSRINEVHMDRNTGSLFMNNANIPLMRLNDCFLHELKWKAGTRGEMYIEGGAINHLNLYQTALLRDAVFSLINVQVYIVQLQELLVHGQLMFRNIRSMPEPFVWRPAILQILEALQEKELAKLEEGQMIITSNSLTKLYALEADYKGFIKNLNEKFKEKPLFRIVDSSLGKTEITGSDLENFHFEYRDSKLLETFFSGTKLPKEKIRIYNKDETQSLPGIAKYEQKVSIYNQLKKIFDNQGDIVEATWYHSKAMDHQELLLKERYSLGGGRWFGEQWFDLLTFRLNKYTNNHGESWRKALRFILVISLAMYSLYYLSLHYSEPFSFQATGRFVGNYFLFLDLTHKIDFHLDKQFLWWLPIFIDFVSRILIGYGIFQFIAAFRRHGRRTG